jgi:hypothetical protein
MNTLLRDERGVVTGWVVRLVVGLAVAGVILFDAAALVINYFGLDSAADDMAVALSTDVADLPSTPVVTCNVETPTPPEFCLQAHQLAQDNDATLLVASIDAEGLVTVKMRRTAETVLVKRLGFLKKYGVARAEGTAGTS